MMQTKILVYLSLLMLVHHLTNGLDDSNVELKEESDENIIQEQPVEETTIREIDRFGSDDSNENDEGSKPVILGTSNVVNSDDDEYDDIEEYKMIVAPRTTVSNPLVTSDLWESSEEEEETTTTTEATHTTRNTIDEYGVKVRISDFQESSEELIVPDGSEEHISTDVHSGDIIENSIPKENILRAEDESDRSGPSMNRENMVSYFHTDDVVDQMEEWQSKLNQTISIAMSNMFDLINEKSRVQENSRKMMETSQSLENDIMTGELIKGLYLNQYQQEFLDEKETLFHRSLEQMKFCSGIVSKLIEYCRNMDADQQDELKNMTVFMNIVEKMEHLLRILSEMPISMDVVSENGKYLDDLKADVSRFIDSPI